MPYFANFHYRSLCLRSPFSKTDISLIFCAVLPPAVFCEEARSPLRTAGLGPPISRGAPNPAPAHRPDLAPALRLRGSQPVGLWS